MAAVAYNADDPLQQAFLSALGLGESGDISYAPTVGVGGSNLAGSSTDSYGFPIWQGSGNSHAAGTYQFEPATWDSIASEFNLNFANPGDQSIGAWELAQQTDPNIYAQLQSGDYTDIQSALKNVWPSVTGNGAAPLGLAADIATDVGTNTTAQAAQVAQNNSSGGTATGSTGTATAGGGSSNPVASFFSGLTGTFAQGALIVIGAVIIFVALWMLLSSQGVVPSPKQVGKDALALGA